MTLAQGGRGLGGRSALGALLIAVWFTLTALPASAHETLIDSDPAADEVLTDVPAELALTFSGEISEPGVQFMVTGPEGRDVVQGTPTVEGAVVTQALAEELVDGDYEATWRVTSSDGHPISGTIPFTIEAQDNLGDDGEQTSQPPATTDPAGPGTDPATPEPPATDDAGQSTSPADEGTPTAGTGAGDDADATTAPPASDVAADDVAPTSGSIPIWGWLVAAAAAVGLVACGFLAFRRN